MQTFLLGGMISRYRFTRDGKRRIEMGDIVTVVMRRAMRPSEVADRGEMADWRPAQATRWLLDPACGVTDRLLSRWIFLRALGLIYFSAFFSVIFQIRGLIGPAGILPAGEYLRAVAQSAGQGRFWYAPTVFWISSGSHMLMTVCWVGIAASLLVFLNLWPQGGLFVCFLCFLSFVLCLLSKYATLLARCPRQCHGHG